MNDLLYSVGLDITDLKTSAKAAKEQSEEIKKGFKGFKDVIEFGGVAAAVIGFFKNVIDYAQNAKGALDANTGAVKRFGEGIDEVKGYAMHLGAQLLGGLNLMGEWVGRQIAIVKYGKEQVELGEQIEAQMKETLAAIEKDKKITEEIGKIRGQIVEVEKQTAEESAKQLTIRDQILKQIYVLARAQDELAASEGNKLTTARAALVVAQEQSKLTKLYGEQAKENAKTEQKAVDDHAKVLAKLAAEIAEDDEEQRVRDAARYEREQALIAAKAAAAVDAQDAYNAEIAAAEDLLDLQYQLTEATQDFISLKTVGQGDSEISDAQLKAKIANLENDIGSRKAAAYGSISSVGGAGSYGNDPFISIESSYLEQAKKELEARDQLRRYVAQFGEQGAARFYQKDLTEYDRLMEFVKASPEAKKTNNTLNEINDRLSLILPRY